MVNRLKRIPTMPLKPTKKGVNFNKKNALMYVMVHTARSRENA
jgi:hypothetical protein